MGRAGGDAWQQPHLDEPLDHPAATDLAAALPAWTTAPMSEEGLLEDATTRGWRLEPAETRVDLLVIDSGWGVERTSW
jgi:hypothetical protein